MDWVEIIRLRAAAGVSRDDALRAAGSVLQEGAPGLVDYRVFVESRVDSDMAVHLHYQLGRGQGPNDGLGVRLAAAFREYGLVDRGLWFRVSGMASECKEER